MFKTLKKIRRDIAAYSNYDPDMALLNSARDPIDLEMIERDISRRRSGRF